MNHRWFGWTLGFGPLSGMSFREKCKKYKPFASHENSGLKGLRYASLRYIIMMNLLDFPTISGRYLDLYRSHYKGANQSDKK